MGYVLLSSGEMVHETRAEGSEVIINYIIIKPIINYSILFNNKLLLNYLLNHFNYLLFYYC